MRLKIRSKLVLTFLAALVISAAAVVGAVVGIIAVVTGGSTNQVNVMQVSQIADRQAKEVEKALAAGASRETLRHAAIPAQLPPGVRVQVLDKQALVWVDTDGGEGRTATGAEMLAWVQLLSDEHVHTMTLPKRLMVGGEVWGFYGVTYTARYGPNISLNDGTPESRLVLSLLIGGFSLALIVNIALFWLFGWNIVKPLRQLSAVVSQIAGGDLSARTQLNKRHDELGQLGQDLDLMAAKLGEARDQAAAADEARRFLVAAASHDLRTPLTAVLAHAEAIRTNVSEDPKQSLAVIEEKGLMLKSLIDDLFELAALDAAPGRWQTIRTDLAELVRQSVVGVLPELEAGGIEVAAEIPEEPLWANLAPGKLERVMDNLLANGQKYGGSGHWLGVRVAHVGARIRVEVANRGPAIPDAVAGEIFERFYRADGARTSNAAGSGLGLAIAREIIVRHGGEIGVQSPADGGAIFWFEIPAM